MDVDALFPNLSRLVRCKGRRTLSQLATEGEPESDNALLTLDSSCWEVATGLPEWAAGGPPHYLRTLDEFVRRLPDGEPIGSIRTKISSKGSGFLDMVVEASWALRLWDKGFQARLEQPLDPRQPKGKNADIVVTVRDGRYWLDCNSVTLNDDRFREKLSGRITMLRPNSDPIAELARKAREKYQEKFELVLRSGSFGNDRVGILLCVVKADDVSLHVLFSSTQQPPWLFDEERPGLDLVCVHSLRPSERTDILQPWVLATWQAQ